LKEKVFAAMPRSEKLWPYYERGAQEMMSEDPVLSKTKVDDPEYNRTIAHLIVKIAIADFGAIGERRSRYLTELVVAQHQIPNRDALDRLLRYEAMIDRTLNRALERLERMQRARCGEMVPTSAK
jgi:hypothetical protein